MLNPSYDKYSLEELYDALSHIVKEDNPVNYKNLMEKIKERENEAEHIPSEEELENYEKAKAYNRKMKKRLLISLSIIVVLIIALNVILSILEKPYDHVLSKIESNPKLFMQVGMPFEEINQAVITIDSVEVDGRKIAQQSYEIFIKGSNNEATVFVTFNLFGDNNKKIVKAEMQVKGKANREKIPLEEKRPFNRNN